MGERLGGEERGGGAVWGWIGRREVVGFGVCVGVGGLIGVRRRGGLWGGEMVREGDGGVEGEGVGGGRWGGEERGMGVRGDKGGME